MDPIFQLKQFSVRTNISIIVLKWGFSDLLNNFSEKVEQKQQERATGASNTTRDELK